MSEWVPLIQFASGAVVALVSGVLLPLWLEHMRNRRNDKEQTFERRRRVAEAAVRYGVAMKELSLQVGNAAKEPEASDPYSTVTRDDHRAFVEIELYARFDAPDALPAIDDLIKACNALLRLMQQYRKDVHMARTDALSILEVSNNLLRDQPRQLVAIDHALSKVLSCLSGLE